VSESKKPLDARLTEWLETQGYPLEMEVAQEFRAKAFSVAQGTYYADPDTKQPREIDIAASVEKMLSDVNVRLVCFVECKVSRDKPWVLFTSRRGPNDGNFDYFSMVASRLGLPMLTRMHWQRYFPLPVALAPRERLGYGLAQGFREGNLDITHTAVMSAAKASVSRTQMTNEESLVEALEEATAELVVPSVVIDGQLFEYFLDEDGSKQLRRLHWGVLQLGTLIPGHSQSTLVHIVTKEGLPEFAEGMRQLFGHFHAICTEHFDSLQTMWTTILNKAKEARAVDRLNQP
jgi:hypothetical protein